MLVPLTARQTTDMAAAALASGRGAGLPELLELIQTLANRMEHISLGDIAELVEQDPVVSARLISMANMIANNPGMTPLTNVTHAIHQIGFQRVRSLAISLMLLKSSGARQNPPEQRQAASRALCAGLIAQACAKQITAVDTEMVFACATLRQLGRIVLPVVSIEHYRAALELAEEESENIAFRRVFGLTPLELSRELLKGYTLPAEVRQALEDFISAAAMKTLLPRTVNASPVSRNTAAGSQRSSSTCPSARKTTNAKPPPWPDRSAASYPTSANCSPPR
jgi:HD-like signal output (HDOD) protein